jgi:hypothetical protein
MRHEGPVALDGAKQGLLKLRLGQAIEDLEQVRSRTTGDRLDDVQDLNGHFT